MVSAGHIAEVNGEEPCNIGSESFEAFDNVLCMIKVMFDHGGWSGGDIGHSKCTGF